MLHVECGCTSSRFFVMVQEDKAGIVWLFVRVFWFWHAQCEHIYRAEKASATWRGWVPLKICNICIFECTACRWIDPLRLKKATKHEQRRFFRWQMEMITHCGERLVLAPLQNCHDVYIIHLRTSQLFLCPFISSLLYIHMYQLAGESVLWQWTLRRFSPQWPLILSCKTWCRCTMEYWVNPV